MNSTLSKYKIGLGVIGVFTAIVVVVVLSQAGGTKQDNATYKAANTIANNLNSFTGSNDYVPNNLADVGSSNVPSTITYQKLSDTKYKFCVYYKTASSDFSASGIESSIISSALSQSSGDSDYSSSNYGYLVILPNHPKGNFCQTVDINPSDVGNNKSTGSGSSSGSGNSTYSGSGSGSSTQSGSGNSI